MKNMRTDRRWVMNFVRAGSVRTNMWILGMFALFASSSAHQTFTCASTSPCRQDVNGVAQQSVVFYLGSYHQESSSYGKGKAVAVHQGTGVRYESDAITGGSAATKCGGLNSNKGTCYDQQLGSSSYQESSIKPTNPLEDELVASCASKNGQDGSAILPSDAHVQCFVTVPLDEPCPDARMSRPCAKASSPATSADPCNVVAHREQSGKYNRDWFLGPYYPSRSAFFLEIRSAVAPRLQPLTVIALPVPPPPRP